MPDSPPTIPLRPYRLIAAIFLCSILVVLAGCSRFRPGASADYVYVTVPQIYLRDRVAVVANHVAEVTNGERLKVLEPGRRFMEVETPQGAVGWIESHAVIDQTEFDQFQNLAKQHLSQPPVATAVLYNELYIHLAPGRKTQRFYLLPPNTKVSMLERASVPRMAPGGILGLPAATPNPKPVSRSPKARKQSFESQFLPAVPMEDWWLVRNSSGRTGWMLSRDLAVDVPEDVAQYAESERMIGAYVLRTVEDPDSGKSDGKVPEYVTVLTPYKEGLPYDFDQVRVFTWDIRRHRYGTAFRLRDIAGFFPVKVAHGGGNNPSDPQPVFAFQVAAGNAVTLNPETGVPHAAQLETMTYRLEGNLVRKILPSSAQSKAPEAQEIQRPGKHGRRHRHRMAR